MGIGLVAACLTVGPTSWSMVVGGDLMLNGIAPSSKVLSSVKPWFAEADIATANLEIPLTTSKSATKRKTAADLKAKNQFILKASPGHGKYLQQVGFDLLGLANNHAMDYGYTGVREMSRVLDKHQITWCGAGATADEALRHQVVSTSGGVRVAFLALLAFQSEGGRWKCTPATLTEPGVGVLFPKGVANAGSRGGARAALLRRLKWFVSSARADADVVVVWLHWGLEKQSAPTAYQVGLGRSLVESGADVVLGAHPHVLQGAELYAGRPIFYSLGNLISPRPASTGVFRLSFEGRKLVKTEMLPCNISGGRVVAVPKTQRAARIKAFANLCNVIPSRHRHQKSQALVIE